MSKIAYISGCHYIGAKIAAQSVFRFVHICGQSTPMSHYEVAIESQGTVYDHLNKNFVNDKQYIFSQKEKTYSGFK